LFIGSEYEIDISDYSDFFSKTKGAPIGRSFTV
jgi:hypothetical protein